MSSLVADYGTSGSESSSESSESDNESEPSSQGRKSPGVKLPPPSFNDKPTCVSSSVFVNPYVEAENAEKAVLEKHVKMIPTKDSITSIDGKKICWMYRKGRCRFGHKCKFAHDSDLFTKPTKEEETNEGELSDEDRHQKQNQVKKKKRPGLSSQLVPGKKVMKIYKKQEVNGFH